MKEPGRKRISPVPSISHNEYDGQGHIIAVTDANGSRYLENRYDERGRVVYQNISGRLYFKISYDDQNRRNTNYSSETGENRDYYYNDQMLTERVAYEDGTCISYEYSDQNLRTAEVSREGARTAWEYDIYGRVVCETKPDGFETHYEYDENHDLVRVWDTDGRETVNRYDGEHNLLSVKERISDGQWKENVYQYDEKGRRISARDGVGNETTYWYAENHAHPAGVVTPRGEETAYGYDAVGRRMSIENAYGTVELSYNSRNFVTKRVDGEGNTSRWAYDRMGNLTSYCPARNLEEGLDGYEYWYGFLARQEDTITPLKEHRRIYRNFAGDITRSIHPVSYREKGEEGEGTLYDYDSDGNLIRIHYPDGGVERRFYDLDGNMVRQVQPESYDAAADDGAGSRYAYDACGRLTLVQDPEGNILHTYEYNGHGQVVREVDGEGKEILYTYNGLGWKTREQVKVRETDRAFYRVIAYSYDDQGNKTEEAYGQQEVEKDGEPVSWHRIHFSYDKNNHLTLVRDDFGAQMRYDYDCLGNVTLEERVIEENIRSIVRYAYNKNGWRIQKTEEIQGNDPVKSAVTRYSYDANGNLIKIITPKGFVIRKEYDADDRLTEERVIDKKNGIDRRVQYVYDAAGKVLKRTILGADGECLEAGFSYDLKDRITQKINPGGAATRYIYDQNDHLLKEISPYGYDAETDNGAGATYTYDSRGNRIRVTNALGEVVQELSYNLQDRPVMQKDAFGNRTEFSYGLDGQVKDIRHLSDENWNGSAGGGTEQSGAADQSAENGQHTVQQYEYNARGQIVGIMDGNRNPISYDVDHWGRITGVGFADGATEGYEYTTAGQVSKTTDGNGNSVRYRYNSLGKVCERIDQFGYAETFQYDPEGNLSLHTDRDGNRIYRTYNVFGKPVYEKATDRNGEKPCITTWRYDSIGRLVRAVCDGHSYEYEYDQNGHLKEKRSSGKRLISYTYDSAGQMSAMTDPAGVTTYYEHDILGRTSRIYSSQGMEVKYAYDCLNRLTQVFYGNGVETCYKYDSYGNLSSLNTTVDGSALLSFTYEYDGNGNRISKAGEQRLVSGGTSLLDISYAYDVRGRLLEEKRNNKSSCYTYDAAGNRIRKENPEGTTVYCYNGKNQLVSEEGIRGRKTFTYSRQGSILKEEGMSGTRRFRYNSKNQQIRVEREDGRVQENLYDAEGLRYGMREDGQFIRFAYHSGELLYEGGDNNQTSYHLGAGIEAFRRGGETCYYHQDEQLSTALVTNQTGESQNHYQYDAFGNELEISEQISNRIRYTDQQYDQVTGQYYLRARYYNPLLGRFMQEDVYQGDGLNLYAYCDNNPVMYYDPSGYAEEEYEDAKFGETDNQEETEDSLWNPTEKKGNLWAKGKMRDHYDKHGDDFGAKSPPEYSDMAVEFGTRASDGSIIQVFFEGFVYRYEPSTNTVFVGTRGGRIKTFYIYDGREDDFVINILKSLGLIE